jgi:signal transduction histidine kinase
VNQDLNGSSPYVIETSGLTKRFGERTAVDRVELRVPRGSAFGYLGPNGAGKTTLIRMLLGLTRPSAGAMRLLGRPLPAERAAALARVGAIVEEPRFDRPDHILASTVLLALSWTAGASLGELHGRAIRAERERAAEARRAVMEEHARIARELHDVIAHNVSVMVVQAAAGADRASVLVRHARGQLELEVRDNGRGPLAGGDGGGRGIIGMHERATLYGGDLRAGPAPGGGFAVRARFPIGAG